MTEPNKIKYTLDIEDLKRRIRDKVTSFPKISFIIYIILAIASAIFMFYVLTFNDNNDTNITYKIFKWSLYLFSIILFIINCILLFLDFKWKKIIIGFLMIIQVIIAASSIIIAQYFGHISSQNFVYYIISHVLNIFAGVAGFIPLFLVY